MRSILFLAAAAHASPFCCWSNWGDETQCALLPDGKLGLCSPDWVQGCYADSECSTRPPTPSPTPQPSPKPVPTPTPQPAPKPTPAPAPQGKTPLYLVLRMDDITVDGGEAVGSMVQAINWSRSTQVKFNFGVIAKDWPTACTDNPSATHCQHPVVTAMRDAYANGDVLGADTGDNVPLEIGCHAFDHDNWGEYYQNKAWMQDDIKKASGILNTAFPKASLRTFTPPQNLADRDTMEAVSARGYDILTTQGTLGCPGSWRGAAPCYNYFTGPCTDYNGACDCVPADDVYATSAAFQKVSGTDTFSAPNGCANTWYGGTAGGGSDRGIYAAEALGEDGPCGCTAVPNVAGAVICPVIASAENNALKSNGLHWAVLMMHPQSVFPGNQAYDAWLDEFLALAKKSVKYDIHFVHFQDLVELKASAARKELVI